MVVEATINWADGTNIAVCAESYRELFEIISVMDNVVGFKAKLVKTGDMRQGKCK